MEHKHVEGREKQEARRVTLDKVGRSKEMLCNTNVSLKLEQMLNEKPSSSPPGLPVLCRMVVSTIAE